MKNSNDTKHICKRNHFILAHLLLQKIQNESICLNDTAVLIVIWSENSSNPILIIIFLNGSSSFADMHGLAIFLKKNPF